MRSKKEVESVTSAERGNLITLVTYSLWNTRVPEKKKKEIGAYGWSTGGLNFGLPSKWSDSDGYIS